MAILIFLEQFKFKCSEKKIVFYIKILLISGRPIIFSENLIKIKNNILAF